jgi:O-antigen/teichoic acid export membrane protein
MSIKKHTSYNLAGMMIPLVLSLITVPFYIHTVGESRYGVLAIAWLLLGYFGFFDLGLGAAAAQRIAALGPDAHQERAEVFTTALTINVALGVLGGALLWPVSLYVINNVMTMNDLLRTELVDAVPWLTLGVPIATSSGVLIGALQGRGKFLDLNVTSTIGSALGQTVPLIVALCIGPHLPLLIVSVLVCRAISVMLMYWRCRLCFASEKRVRITREGMYSLLRFGGWVTISSLLGPLLLGMDRFAIGSLLGAEAIAYYTVPFQLAERMVIIPTALCSALLPKVAAASEQERRAMITSTIHVLTSVMTPVTVVGVLLIPPFLSRWISPAFALSAGLSAQLLLVGFWAGSMALVPYMELRATGRPRIIAKCHLGELLPYFGLLYIGLKYGGLPGAGIVFIVRCVSDLALLMYFAKTPRQIIPVMVKQFAFLSAAFAFGMIAAGGSLFWFLGFIAIGLCSVAYSWIKLPKTIRLQMLSLVRLKPI